MFRLLLDAGADVNVTNAGTQPPAAKDDGDLRHGKRPRPRVRGPVTEGGTQRTRATDGPSQQ